MGRSGALVAALAVLAGALGCTAAPVTEEMQVADGRVLTVAVQRASAGQPVGGPMLPPMPQGGLAAPGSVPPAFSPMYVYDLKLGDGRVVRTESPLRFGVGDCVRLSYKEGSVQGGLVRGRLAKGAECK